MKIAIIQNNPKDAAIKENAASLMKAALKAQQEGAALIVMPRFALGKCALESEYQAKKCAEETNLALLKIAGVIKSSLILGAYFEDNGQVKEGAAIIERGEVRYEKCGGALCKACGKQVLIILGSAAYAIKEKPDFIINLAANYYIRGKRSARQKEIMALFKQCKSALIYANLCGAGASNIYEGASFIAAGHIAQAKAFKTDIIISDCFAFKAKQEGLAIDDIADLNSALILGISDYFAKSGFSKAIIGLSGGIDSALAAALSARALGGENVLGVLLPSAYTSKASIDDSLELASNLGMPHKTVPIGPIYRSALASIKPKCDFGVSITLQNLQSRIRGLIIMAISNEERRLAISTGNKSEIAMGYYTLYGDAIGAIAPLADLLKKEVYELARYINKEKEIIPLRAITRPPSAELKPNQKDEDELPQYEALDSIIELYLAKDLGKFKNCKLPQDMIDKTLRRIEANSYKRRQLPMGLRVSNTCLFL